MNAIQRNLRDFDVIHVHSWQQFPDVVLHYYAKKFGVPYVLQLHGALPRIMTKKRLKLLHKVFFGQSLLRDASKIIALTSEETKQLLREGISRERIETVPNGIDLSEYSILPHKGSFRKKFGIDKDRRIVLYLGRIHKIKGIDILVRAFASATKKLDNVELVIAGPDDGYLDQIIALVKALEISDRVLIAGPMYGRRKLEAYVDADLFVLPSRYEIFGMSALESIACGTPVILTENCGIAEYLKDRISLVVPPIPKSVEKALLEILENEALRVSISRSSLRARNLFDISGIVLKLEEIYHNVSTPTRS
jgi:glycosyltransferase involved in cell wall biosynthesis